MSQDQLRAFYEVSKQKSFTKAASEVGLTQSALSHRIKKLEGQLETTLIIRDPAGIRLTEAGDRLLEYCRLQQQIESELLADLTKPSGKELTGFLRIGGASTVLNSVVVPSLAKFIVNNPSVHFEIMERELRDLPELLQTGRADFIVTCGKIESAHFEGHYLGKEVNVLVESTKPSRKNTYLDHDARDQTTFDFLKKQGLKTMKLDRCFMDNINGILAGVEAGLGKAVIPKHLLKNRKSLSIVKSYKSQNVPVYVYYLKQSFYSRLHQAMIRELTVNAESFLNCGVD